MPTWALIGEIYTPAIAILPIGDHYTMGPLPGGLRGPPRSLRPRSSPGTTGRSALLTGTPEALRGELARIGVSATVHEARPGEVVRAFA